MTHKNYVTSDEWRVTSGVFLALFLAGCASITNSVTSETSDGEGRVEKKVTTSRATAFWDAKTTLDKLRVSNGKTHSIGLIGSENEASSTNVTAALDALTRLLQSLK